MATVLFSSGALKVSIRYLWQKQKNGVWYYRRRYPREVREILESQGHKLPPYKVQSLRTYDQSVAAKRVATLAAQDDDHWWKLSQGIESTNAREQAVSVLARYGLEPVAQQRQAPESLAAVDVFFDHLERKRPDDLTEDGKPLSPHEFLPEHERVALQILRGEYQHKLSDAKKTYLSLRPESRKLTNAADNSFDLVFGVLGDRPISDYKRKEVQTVVSTALDNGLKTTTIKRRLGTVRAAVNDLIREEELDLKNPFTDFVIKGLGEDANERTCLTSDQLEGLRAYVRAHDSDTSNMLGLLVDTGARVAEVAGLLVDDVVLDDEIPHVVIHKNPLRRLKTKSSTRRVPLVGDALLAATRARAAANGRYLFKRYMSASGVKNDNASAAMRKVTARLGCKTPYWLRHTMRTRLRNSNVPEPRVNEIGGWARQSVSQGYGVQTALQLMKEDLERSINAKV